MRSYNYKFHGIALAVICGLITIMYLILAPKPVAPVDNTLRGDRYIEIYSATWGQECNAYIRQIIANPPAPQKDENGEIIKRPELKVVELNNVLPRVSEICNGRLECEIATNSETLGVEPLPSCFKRLEMSYRCFSYDRLWKRSIDQGKIEKIDCSANANSPKSTPAAGQ